jgi:hypothetical protein
VLWGVTPDNIAAPAPPAAAGPFEDVLGIDTVVFFICAGIKMLLTLWWPSSS